MQALLETTKSRNEDSQGCCWRVERNHRACLVCVNDVKTCQIWSCLVDSNKLPTITKLTLWKKKVCVARLNLSVVQFVLVTVVNAVGAGTVNSFCASNFSLYWLLPFLKNGDGKRKSKCSERKLRLSSKTKDLLEAVHVTDGCNNDWYRFILHSELQWARKFSVLSSDNVGMVFCHWETVNIGAVENCREVREAWFKLVRIV